MLKSYLRVVKVKSTMNDIIMVDIRNILIFRRNFFLTKAKSCEKNPSKLSVNKADEFFQSCFQALSVGIFPYVLKLLQSSARELRPLLVFIWAKILAVDSVSRLSTYTLFVRPRLYYQKVLPNIQHIFKLSPDNQ